MTATIPDTDILEDLDWQPDCYRCEQAPATHRLVFVCGCDGLTCLPCVTVMERYFKDALAYAAGVPHWFECNGCGARITVWPIREVQPL